ncbi:MAG TPA: TfuA-like protein, partial [Burkholderiaceae bacterium]|nr:TfuA-like protein [Burkholderiaceae bacterium]
MTATISTPATAPATAAKVHVFLGPTLSVAEARAELDAIYHPPAAVGDVYAAACQRPDAIAIIDGFFERVPSVWHKEILWAMAEGVHVFGAASMGALRAAELVQFGMEGVGQVFTAFREGILQDDDEVAVTHDPPQRDYRPRSEAMVNIRATLTAAASAGVIADATRARLERLAKRLFYGDRSYAALLAAAPSAGIAAGEVAAVRSWLPRGRVDAKRSDALALLRLLRARVAAGISPKQVAYAFEHTHSWEALQRKLRPRVDREAPSDAEEEAIFDELRLRGRFVAARRAALGRLLALAEAREAGRPFPGDEVEAAAAALRHTRGLLSAAEYREWLLDNAFTPETLQVFLRDEARVRWVDASMADASMSFLADHLRLT